jgi:aryl-alcohol dehydrogenase-like predicted oxidoreductase
MFMRKLGSSGIEISAVGFGAWVTGGWMWGGADDRQSIAAIHAALDLGINLVDTAPMYGYGHSEEVVGQAIRDRRDKVVLATKCGLIWDREEGTLHFYADDVGATLRPVDKKIYKNLRPASIRAEVERSLRNLQTDRIDLLQTHWQDPSTPLADTVAELQRLKQEGKIRAIGVSNCSLDQLKDYGPIDSAQEKYSMLDRDLEENGILQWCREHSVSMLAYSPLANGLLTGKLQPDRQYNPGDLRKANPRFRPQNVKRINDLLRQLEAIAQRYNATIGQLVIAWTAAQPGITSVLCGARDVQQATENVGAGKIELSAEDITTMGQLIRGQGSANQ